MYGRIRTYIHSKIKSFVFFARYAVIIEVVNVLTYIMIPNMACLVI